MDFSLSSSLVGSAVSRPSDGLALDLQFAADKTLTARKGPTPAFTRGSGATFVDSDGLVKYGPENTILQSEDFGTSWSPDGGLVAVSTNVITSPSGLVNADKITENTTTSARRISIGSATAVAGVVYTFSCYLKAAERNIAQLAFGGIFGNQYQNFIIGGASAGTLGNSSGVSSPQIIELANNWYRCTLTITSAGAGATQVTVGPLNADTALRWPTYVGTIGSGIYAWGAQLERSSTVCPYIPTTTAAVYGPRFDHNPVTPFACKGLLIEESKTNLVLQSDDFASASWAIVNATVSANATTSPDGLTTADKLINVNTATGRIQQGFVLTGANTMSIFAKAGEWGWILLSPLGAGTGCWFNLSNGTVGTQVSGYVGSITPFGNGWYRCSVSFTGAGTSTTARIIPTNADNTLTNGNGTSGIFIWGAQLEAGAFATSYIPTTTASVIRSADVCSITGSDFSGFYNQPEGTWNVGFTLTSSLTSTEYLIDKNTTGVPVLYKITNLIRAGQNNQFQINAGVTLVVGSSYKAAFGYKSGDYGLSVNGSTVSTSSYSANAPALPTDIFIGSRSSFSVNSPISSVRYYKKRLPNAKLQTITV